MKINRITVHQKYSGKCGYCGVSMDLKDMQVDHVVPQRMSYKVDAGLIYCYENYMPSCRSCNNYKSGNPLEIFRLMISQQIEVMRRSRPTFRLAERYGLIECKPKPIVFYFETINPGE